MKRIVSIVILCVLFFAPLALACDPLNPPPPTCDGCSPPCTDCNPPPLPRVELETGVIDTVKVASVQEEQQMEGKVVFDGISWVGA
ncbi:MAG: hypothetical protein NTW13_03140 [Candidatus Omnitrophica bacterium]|nr:hypothetical protein [Candidatus Omnitrophota bacterium]